MKKNLLLVFSVFTTLVMLGGCSSDKNKQSNESVEKTTAEITTVERTTEHREVTTEKTEETTYVLSSNFSSRYTETTTYANNEYADNSLGTTDDSFTFYDIEYDPTPYDYSNYGYTHTFDITVKNSTNSTKYLWSDKFYIIDPNGNAHNFSNYDFTQCTGPDVDTSFRPGQESSFHVIVDFYPIDTIIGSTLYYDDKPICTFN